MDFSSPQLQQWFYTQLEGHSQALNIEYRPQWAEPLMAYLELLYRWNRVYNLTHIVDKKKILSHHLLDCLAIVPFLTADRILDVGTGPGFPGILLSLYFPEKKFVLLDSREKRMRFLHQVHYQLKLSNVELVVSRVEHYHPTQLFDGVVTRAFSSVSDFCALSGHLVADDGQALLMKGKMGEMAAQELAYGLKVEKIEPLQVPTLNSPRALVLLYKPATGAQ